MTRLWLVLLFLTGIGLTAVWVVDNPGQVVIRWGHWRIDTSLAFLLLLAITAAWLMAWFYTLLRDLSNVPKYFSERRQLRHYQHGLEEFTYSVAALAASDIPMAEAHARKAQKLLGATPLGLLLSAQIAKSRGDDKKTLPLLEQMLAHKETEYLAARLLSDAASKQQALPRALQLAERAHAVNPKDAAATATIVSLKLKMGQCQEALAAINRAAFRGRTSRSEVARWRGMAHLAQSAACLDQGKTAIAAAEAHKALKSLPGFVPAILLAARAHDAGDRPGKAASLLLKAWAQSPHPHIAALLETLAPKLPARKQTRIRDALSKAPADHSGTMWTCRACGRATSQWDMHCGACGAFDAQEWK